MERADGFGCACQELAVLLVCSVDRHAEGELSHAWFSPFVLSAIPALDAPAASKLWKAEGKRCHPLQNHWGMELGLTKYWFSSISPQLLHRSCSGLQLAPSHNQQLVPLVETPEPLQWRTSTIIPALPVCKPAYPESSGFQRRRGFCPLRDYTTASQLVG